MNYQPSQPFISTSDYSEHLYVQLNKVEISLEIHFDLLIGLLLEEEPNQSEINRVGEIIDNSILSVDYLKKAILNQSVIASKL